MDDRTVERATVTMPFMLTWLKKAVFDDSIAVANETGVKLREAKYFFPLMRGPLTEKRLCHLLGVDKANTSRAIISMFDAGIVKKGRKISGRSYEFELTEKGHRIGTAILERIYTEIKKITEDISDEDMLVFLDVLEKICIASDNELEMAEIIANLKRNVGRKVRAEVVPKFINRMTFAVPRHS